jgi:hypothetical protein
METDFFQEVKMRTETTTATELQPSPKNNSGVTWKVVKKPLKDYFSIAGWWRKNVKGYDPAIIELDTFLKDKNDDETLSASDKDAIAEKVEQGAGIFDGECSVLVFKEIDNILKLGVFSSACKKLLNKAVNEINESEDLQNVEVLKKLSEAGLL